MKNEPITLKDKKNALELAYTIVTDKRNTDRYTFSALTDMKTMERFGYADMLRVLEAMYHSMDESPAMQKPLTKEELRGLIAAGHEVVIFCETKYDSQTYATIIYDGKMFDRYGETPGVKHMNFETYGKTWRAWATMPTEEERAAAPWEE